ncbi:replication-relaxation family protein [Psychrobacillus sp. FSL K6-2365]|uniref:replication-relaxation family protein n=1 Tax=Psychrobacillus sp. FSL K6-2365 TaxID=2921546 RepID=UPI0030F9FC34
MKRKQLSQRQEQILLLLKKYDFLSRDQINKYFKLGSIRNTNMVLYNISDYLMTVREGYQSIYYLSKLGRDYVECQKIRKKGNHVRHIIMRNEFWLFYKCPRDWKNEVKISNGNHSVVADAVFTRNGFYHFLEVDNLQSMKENRAKITRYKNLSESLVKQYGYHPTLVWLTTTEHRRKQLEKESNGLKTKVYTLSDIN